MIQSWLTHNWHWITGAIAFSASIFIVAFETGYKPKWAYQALMLSFLLIAMSIMMLSLWQIRAGKLPPLQNPYELPRPSFIMMVLLTVAGIFGYFYITVLKLSLSTNNCYIVVKRTDESRLKVFLDFSEEECFWLSSIEQMCLALFLAMSCFYIIQKSKVHSSRCQERILEGILNFFFAIFFIRSIFHEVYLLIEDYCYLHDGNDNNTLFIFKKLCPQEPLNINHALLASNKSIFCFDKDRNETRISEEQKAWVNVHAQVLRDVTVSTFTELMPILLVCHLLSCGNGAKIARKGTIELLKKFNSNKNVTVWINRKEVSLQTVLNLPSMPEIKGKWLIKLLAFLIPLIGISTWNGSFFVSMGFEEETHAFSIVNLALLALARIFGLILFALLLLFLSLKMIQSWLTHNWHWITGAIAFSASIFIVAFETGYKPKWAYQALMLSFLLIAMSIMMLSLWQIRAGKLPPLQNPYELPRPSFIMMVLLTVAGIFGYFYITVLKLSLSTNNCYIVVKRTDESRLKVFLDFSEEECFWLSSIEQMCLALFLAMSCLKSIQADVRERILEGILNFFFAIFFIRSIFHEVYLLIEDYCYLHDGNDNNTLFIFKKLCPQEPLNINHALLASNKSIFCFDKDRNETRISEEQKAWVNVHAQVLRDVTVSTFTELMPILLVCHLLSCGNGAKIARKGTIELLKKFNSNKNVTVWINRKEVSLQTVLNLPSMPEIKGKWLIKLLAFLIPLIGISTWNGSFFVSMGFEEETHAFSIVNLALLALARIFGLILFALLINWTWKIPNEFIDFNLKAISGHDQCLMWVGLFFIIISQFCCLVQFGICIGQGGESLGLKPNHYKKTGTITLEMSMEIFYKTAEPLAHFLSTLALRKIAALPNTTEGIQGHSANPLNLCHVFQCCFFQNYFTLAESKELFYNIDHELSERQRILDSFALHEPNNIVDSVSILLYEVEYITKIGGYLFNMTSALAWFDIVIRFIEMGIFNISKKS